MWSCAGGRIINFSPSQRAKIDTSGPSIFSSRIILFPAEPVNIVNDYAKLLFDLSSPLSEDMIMYAQGNYNVSDGARGFVFNADAYHLINFLSIGSLGSSPAQ